MPPSVEFRPATRPTMYFIGVTTRQSSINAIFPLWAERLGLGDCELRGLDFPVGGDPAGLRAAVEFIKHDPLSLGALVTTHKLAVGHACREQFDEIEPLSRSLGEISSVYKRAGRLHGRTVDPWAAGHALGDFLPRAHFAGGGEALILGAGGAGTALAWHLAQGLPAGQRPARIHLADRHAARLETVRQLHAGWLGPAPLAMHPVPDARAADAVLARLPAGSLVVNATGAGKDTPGSPLTAAAVFPERGYVWEFNYRGELEFLAQAHAQQGVRSLHVADGWRYFLHGWTRVIADVFDREIPVRGDVFDELGGIAARTR